MNNDLKIALDKIGDILFTKRCEFCGDVIYYGDMQCEICEKLPLNNPPYCEYCGVNKTHCNCEKKKAEYKRITAPYFYVDNVVKAVHRFKDSDMPFLAKRFGRDIAKQIEKEYCDIVFDAITFVPVTARTLRNREYNQSKLLAQEISQIMNIELYDVLKKVEETKPQKSLTARERKVNVYGVFDVKDSESIKDKTFLLIDDVKTTGSTLSECAKMLKIYGAKAVYATTLAVVVKDGN